MRDLQAPFSLPEDARLVTLVRHGAAAHDVEVSTLTGRADPGLTALGVQQAEAVARRLATRHDERDRAPSGVTLFSSGMRRTDETAGPLVEALGVDLQEVPELCEVHLGAYEGAEFERARARGSELMAQAFVQERWDVLTGAEPMADFSARVGSGLLRVAEQIDPGSRGIVFTHGGVVAELCRQVTDSRPFAFVDVDNASLTTLLLRADGAWVLRGFNDTAHLAGPVRRR